METETEINLIDEELTKAYERYNEITKNPTNEKLKQLSRWIQKESKVLYQENFKPKNNLYNVYSRGTIVKVDLGINIGSELSNTHFAIVLNKNDTKRSAVLNIIPLSSKNNTHYKYIGDLIIDSFCNRLNKALEKITIEISLLSPEEDTKTLNKKRKELDDIKKMINYYSQYAKSSYVCCNQVKCISKERIINPRNKFDIISRAKCNSKTMKKIDDLILNYYTNIKISNSNENISQPQENTVNN